MRAVEKNEEFPLLLNHDGNLVNVLKDNLAKSDILQDNSEK